MFKGERNAGSRRLDAVLVVDFDDLAHRVERLLVERTDIAVLRPPECLVVFLRMALCQLTGDPALTAMRVEKQSLRGGVFSRTVLAAEHHEEVKRKALAMLKQGALEPIPPPDRDEARCLLELFGGAPLSDEAFGLGVEELAFDPFPREANWNNRPAQAVIDRYPAIIVGAGMSGLMAAIQLGRLGIPYAIIERQSGVGGVPAIIPTAFEFDRRRQRVLPVLPHLTSCDVAWGKH